MKQLKKVKLLPLTDLDSLNLKVTSHIDYDWTGLSKEATQELLSKLYKIVGNAPSAIIASKVGDKNFVSTQVKTSKDKSKVFTFPEPNPICIYYKSANEHLQRSYAIKNKIYSEEQHFDHNYHYENFIEYFQETSEGVILLSTTIEGFVNQLLPENVEIEINNVKKKKGDLEWLGPTTKIRDVVEKLTGIDFQKSNPKEYADISLLLDLRNDLIHLKKTSKANITNYQLLFKRLVELDHVAVSDGVFRFINTIIPNYLIEEDGS
ncbi:MAG TPA: hypothetical protein VK826_05795 [Bacteroidia bacterium]|nr:hypothetical protein [Bacteroidia bacterium]